MDRVILICVAACLSMSWAEAQTAMPSRGVTLVDPIQTDVAALLDSSGQIVHGWSLTGTPGVASYLDRAGNLLRTYREPGSTGVVGYGSGVRRIAHDGTVLWDYSVPSGDQHHDIAELPNGNILMLVAEQIPMGQMIALGRDPATVSGPVRAETIIEVQPTGATTGNIVWKWRALDHLVQDFNPARPDFDVVSMRPERIDVNHPPILSELWMHANGIDYNPERDEIVISCRPWNEIWVIDHSTTTAEAAGSTGGNSGRGGDLLYRWGNPAAHDTPGVQQLSEQHDPTWIPPGYPGAGNILCFNNTKGQLLGLGNASAVTEFTPPRDANGDYIMTPGVATGPAAPVWEYFAPIPTAMSSPFISGAQRLPNGNTLVCSGGQGFIFEVGINDLTVWQVTAETTFKARRYDRQLFTSSDEISVAGGSIDLFVTAGTEHAGDAYIVLGTSSGDDPGFVVAGVHVPLNPDEYFDFTLTGTGPVPLANAVGRLDATGNAVATFNLPAGVLDPSVSGLTLHHAAALVDLQDVQLVHVSNARPVTFVP